MGSRRAAMRLDILTILLAISLANFVVGQNDTKCNDVGCWKRGGNSSFTGAYWSELYADARCFNKEDSTNRLRDCTDSFREPMGAELVCGSKDCRCCWSPRTTTTTTTTTKMTSGTNSTITTTTTTTITTTTTTTPNTPTPSCLDSRDQCKRTMGGLGVCVNITSINGQDEWSQLSNIYDFSNGGSSWANRFCGPSDKNLQKDCCVCLKKRPCKD